ncbi:hypothetical protein Q0Z83_001230 [Actinoplanes sichuanensis]|uniref:Uncharacterized protein n=1 Tax=Actinoplanes sichuanensis TaxID=512349 RepID=A0ABW4A1E5_9ACTN|nr:hypothetical protein [Actinoplanes sichuanensis]BEL01932.1 hypothetical protein Q0Z83_001230 [Actinoplanes sichuanensis]
MTATSTNHSGNTLLAVLGIVAALADGMLAALGALAWEAYQDGAFTAAEAGPFIVMGVSGAVGAVIGLLAMIALLRGGHGRGLARATCELTWLRVGAVVIALLVLALVVGVAAAGVFGMVLAVGDACGGLVVTRVAARQSSDG